jgi:phage minor structural protein
MEGENVSVPVLYEANATDFFNKGLGTLPDALTAVVTEERNGEFIFEMAYPADGARADLLENNRIIKVDAGHVLTDQRFVIKKVTPQMNEDGKIYIDVYAEHISYITNDLALKPSVNVSGSANDAMQQWQKAIIDSNEITADSDISTNNSTTWTIDKVQSARLALGGVDGSILDVWGGEYLFDNLHISLRKQRGSSANTLLAYGRNITSFQQEENVEDTYTSIYPYATLNSVSGDTSSLYTIDNYVVDSQYVGNYPSRKILPVDFSSNFENVKVGTKASDANDSDTTVYMTVAEVQSQLKALAQQYITNNDVGIPTVSISVSFVDLSKTSNYADVAPLEQLDLCDIVPVRFTKLGIDTTAKVTHAEWNVLTDSYDKIELGSITATLGQTLNTLTTVAQAAKQVAQDAQNNATIAWQSADGKTTTFKGSSSQDFPTAQHIGDLYWRENGDTTEVYIWDGSEWAFQFSNKTGQNISEVVDKAMSEADTAKQNANAAVETGNQALTKAQSAIDTANAAAENASTANANASAAISNAATAIQQVQSAASDATSATNIANAVKQDVTTLKDGSTMTIAELESGLAVKITKDDMNTALQPYATQSWTSTEISATADEINSSIASVKKTADGNTTDVTSLKQRADGFDTSISNLSTNKADQTWTTNQIQASAAGLNATITSVQTQVNNSAVGTNILTGTSSTNSTTISGTGWYTLSSASNSMNSLLKPNTVYTYSINVLSATWNCYPEIQEFDSNGNWLDNTSGQPSMSTGLRSVTFTTSANAATWRFHIVLQNPSTTQTIVWNSEKAELGSHATDWSANPTDNATVTSVTSLSVTVDGLQTTVSKKVDNDTYQTQIQQLSDNINLRVQKNDVINQINVSSESILIAGNKVHITGSTTIDNAVIKSAMIDSISADKITAGTLNAANVNVINLNANNISSGTLTGVSFHQSSSGHDTWIDGNGVHDYDGSGNNAWIQKGTLQVYDKNGDGFFMDSGKLELTSQYLWQQGQSVKYGLIKLDDDILALGKAGMHIQGYNGLRLDTGHSMFDGLTGALDDNYTGAAINLSDNGQIAIGSYAETWLSAGAPYTMADNSSLTQKPNIYIGTAMWDDRSTVGRGQNIIMQANGIILQTHGEIKLKPNNGDLWLGYARINTGSDTNTWYSGPTGTAWWFRTYGGDMATIHVQSVAQSSLLSLKTNLNKLDPAKALATLTNTDICSYNYKSDLKNGISKTYATAVIDDVNDKPQYNTPYDFISADGTGRDDGTILGYAVASIQELNSKITSLETEIKQLKGAA